MATITDDKVSYRLLKRLSSLVICSRCLRRGKVTPVPQMISNRHSLTNECVECRAANPKNNFRHRKLGKLLQLKTR